MANLDWSLIQSFLAVADTGSLSAAATKTGATQPTIGRHIQTLEHQLSVHLFTRQHRGMALTGAGHRLLDHARTMATAANALGLAAAGDEQALTGTVRLTASVFVANHILPDIIAQIRQDLPEIAIELVASDDSENLLFREADIALRMYRPEQLDMIALHLGSLNLGLFAAESYLARRGTPSSLADLAAHDFVGYDRDERIIRGFRAANIPVTRDFFKTRCDDQNAYWQLVRAGCGLGFSQVRVARAQGVPQISLPEMALPPLEIWLAAHDSLRRTPRVDAVWSHLSRAVAAACDTPNPAHA